MGEAATLLKKAWSSWFRHYDLGVNFGLHEVEISWLQSTSAIAVHDFTDDAHVDLSLFDDWVLSTSPVKLEIRIRSFLSKEWTWHISQYHFIIVEKAGQDWLSNLWKYEFSTNISSILYHNNGKLNKLMHNKSQKPIIMIEIALSKFQMESVENRA